MPTPAPSRSSPGLWAMLRRAGRLLQGRRPVQAVPTRQVQLHALLGILDEAAQAQPAADHAVDACRKTGFISATVLKDVARQQSLYHQLMLRLRALRLDPDLSTLGERTSRLLAHHEWTLNQALRTAQSPLAQASAATTRIDLDGLGATGDALRALRDEVHDRVQAGHDSPEPEGTP